MPIQDAINGTVERRLQMKRQLDSFDTQIKRLTSQRQKIQTELTKLDAGIDQLANALKVTIDKNSAEQVI